MKEMWDYLDMRARSGKVKPGTVSLERQYIGFFASFLLNVRKKTLCQAERADVKAYLASIGTTYSHLTYYARVSAVRRFYCYLVENGLLAKSPLDGMSGKGWVRCLEQSNPA